MRHFAILASFSIVAAAFAACGSPTSSDRPCNEDPFSCSPGLTCWVNASQQYACLTAGTSKEGEACSPVIGPTSPCGEQLMCVQLQGSKGGTCVAFCDNAIPERDCKGGGACTQVSASAGGSAKTRVCLGGTPAPADAGTTTDAASSTDGGAISDAKTGG